MTLGSLQTMSPTQVPSGSGFCPGLQQLGGAVAVPGQYCALGQHLPSCIHTLVASQHAHSLPATFVHICAPLMPQHMRGLFGKNELWKQDLGSSQQTLTAGLAGSEQIIQSPQHWPLTKEDLVGQHSPFALVRSFGQHSPVTTTTDPSGQHSPLALVRSFGQQLQAGRQAGRQHACILCEHVGRYLGWEHSAVMPLVR
jgi:hypothetical protein